MRSEAIWAEMRRRQGFGADQRQQSNEHDISQEPNKRRRHQRAASAEGSEQQQKHDRQHMRTPSGAEDFSIASRCCCADVTWNE
jgi:hypothetical protein